MFRRLLREILPSQPENRFWVELSRQEAIESFRRRIKKIDQEEQPFWSKVTTKEPRTSDTGNGVDCLSVGDATTGP